MKNDQHGNTSLLTWTFHIGLLIVGLVLLVTGVNRMRLFDFDATGAVAGSSTDLGSWLIVLGVPATVAGVLGTICRK